MKKKSHTLSDRLHAVGNLAEFCRVTGLPRRTLNRLRAGETNIHTTTRMAIEAALDRYNRPAKKP